MPTPRRDIAGQRFGKLIAVEPHHRTDRGWWWLVRCDCGVEKVYKLSKLTNGRRRSCGCDQNPMKWGERSTHPSYRSWAAMLSRCYNPKATGFELWGGRGITVCERWRASFDAFLADMGERPPGYSLDRINSDGNYTPGNCQWATFREQTQNRRKWVIKPKKRRNDPDPRQLEIFF